MKREFSGFLSLHENLTARQSNKCLQREIACDIMKLKQETGRKSDSGCFLKPRRQLDTAQREETYSGEFCLKILQFPYRRTWGYSIMSSEWPYACRRRYRAASDS